MLWPPSTCVPLPTSMWVSALSLVSGTLARTLGVLDVSSPQAEVFPLGGEFLVTKSFPVRIAFFRRVALRCFKDLAVVCSESAELEPRAEVPPCLSPASQHILSPSLSFPRPSSPRLPSFLPVLSLPLHPLSSPLSLSLPCPLSSSHLGLVCLCCASGAPDVTVEGALVCLRHWFVFRRYHKTLRRWHETTG